MKKSPPGAACATVTAAVRLSGRFSTAISLPSAVYSKASLGSVSSADGMAPGFAAAAGVNGTGALGTGAAEDVGDFSAPGAGGGVAGAGTAPGAKAGGVVASGMGAAAGGDEGTSSGVEGGVAGASMGMGGAGMGCTTGGGGTKLMRCSSVVIWLSISFSLLLISDTYIDKKAKNSAQQKTEIARLVTHIWVIPLLGLESSVISFSFSFGTLNVSGKRGEQSAHPGSRL